MTFFKFRIEFRAIRSPDRIDLRFKDLLVVPIEQEDPFLNASSHNVQSRAKSVLDPSTRSY